MADIKDTATSATKWARVSAAAQGEYEAGVRAPRRDWMAATLAAESAHTAGMQAALADKRFAKGVKKSGTANWQQNAIEKGPSRYAQGVQLAAGKYESGFKPYADVIKRLVLPTRGPKGDPANIQRVSVVATALHNAKVAALKGA